MILYIVFIVLISTLFIQNSLIKIKRENTILIFLGKPRTSVVFENVMSYLINLVSIILLSYITVISLIKIINIDFEGRFNMTMNILYANYSYLYIPVLSVLMLNHFFDYNSAFSFMYSLKNNKAYSIKDLITHMRSRSK